MSSVDVSVRGGWVEFPGGPRVVFPDFEVDGAGLYVVLGRNGSGKTSLLRVLAGLVPWFSPGGTRFGGRVVVGGVDPRVNREGLLGRVGFLTPDPDLYILGPTPLDDVLYTARLVGRDLGVDDALGLLEDFGVPGDIAVKPVVELSSGYRQRTALASFAVLGAGCWLLDEPTSHIDPVDRPRLLDFLHGMAGERCLLVATHYPDYYRSRGRIVFGEGYEAPGRCSVDGIASVGGDVGVLLEAREVWYKYPGGGDYVLRGAFLRVRGGLVHVVMGPNGSGKSTLLRVLSGVYKPSRGVVEGVSRAAYLPSNPILSFSAPTLREELTGHMVGDGMKSLVEGLLDKPVGVMSTGELKRAALALVASLGYRVLLLDEPEAGLDPWGRCILARLLRRLAGMGCGVVVVSHDLEWASIVGDVWYEMRDGVVVEA